MDCVRECFYLFDLFARFEGEIWVAEYDGQIIGSIGIASTDKSTAQLRWFLIEPEFRGTGIGRHLIAKAIDHCKQKKYSRVFLWTFQDLKAARHLYSILDLFLSNKSKTINGKEVW